MRPYTPRLATIQLVVRIRATEGVDEAQLLPGHRATAFRPARPARVAVWLAGKDNPDILSIADARSIYGAPKHTYLPIPRVDGDETGSQGVVCAFCGSGRKHA